MSRFTKTATSRPLASFLAAGSIAAVIAFSATSSAWAADTQPAAASASTQSASPASSDHDATTGTHIVPHPKDLSPVVVFPGAVHGSGDAQWSDDDASAPELPMAREQGANQP